MTTYVRRHGRSKEYPTLLGFEMSLVLTFALFGCAGNAAKGTVGPEGERRDNEIRHVACDISSKSAEAMDANNDGRADFTAVMEAGRPVCQAADLDFDGRVDMWTYFDSTGTVSRRELDYDRDGAIDEIQLFTGGQLVEKQRVTTPGHRLDTWERYSGGRIVSAERDSNGDGKIDQWWDFKNPDCPTILSDVDGDGRPDPKAMVDYCKESGYQPPEQIANARPEMLRKDTSAIPTETSNTDSTPSGTTTTKSPPAASGSGSGATP
jgi:hypothetical protein